MCILLHTKHVKCQQLYIPQPNLDPPLHAYKISPLFVFMSLAIIEVNYYFLLMSALN